MITFASDKATARIASEFYVNAINVMRGASSVSSTYVGLPEQEAFDIEYWLLEEAKLQRMPKPKSLAGRIALHHRRRRRHRPRDGANASCAKAPASCSPTSTRKSLDRTVTDFAKRFGQDAVRGVKLDVTSEPDVAAAFADASVEFGGIDILVSNAGISSSAPVEETDLAMWNRNMDILATGYFLVSREAFRLMKRQKLGGAIVFVASKNGLAASPNAAAYCTAKAAEIHLARCLALEGAEAGIRVNTVNPDAVLRGSKIWTGEWREQRAAAYKMSRDELEEHYRKRSLLKLNVFPEDIAEAIYFLASDLSAKSTGNIINVDAGNAQSPLRGKLGAREDAMSEQRISADCRRHADNEKRAKAAEATITKPSASSSPAAASSIDAITEKVAQFFVAVPSWGVGTGGTRFARFPGAASRATSSTSSTTAR